MSSRGQGDEAAERRLEAVVSGIRQQPEKVFQSLPGEFRMHLELAEDMDANDGPSKIDEALAIAGPMMFAVDHLKSQSDWQKTDTAHQLMFALVHAMGSSAVGHLLKNPVPVMTENNFTGAKANLVECTARFAEQLRANGGKEIDALLQHTKLSDAQMAWELRAKPKAIDEVVMAVAMAVFRQAVRGTLAQSNIPIDEEQLKKREDERLEGIERYILPEIIAPLIRPRVEIWMESQFDDKREMLLARALPQLGLKKRDIKGPVTKEVVDLLMDGYVRCEDWCALEPVDEMEIVNAAMEKLWKDRVIASVFENESGIMAACRDNETWKKFESVVKRGNLEKEKWRKTEEQELNEKMENSATEDRLIAEMADIGSARQLILRDKPKDDLENRTPTNGVGEQANTMPPSKEPPRKKQRLATAWDANHQANFQSVREPSFHRQSAGSHGVFTESAVAEDTQRTQMPVRTLPDQTAAGIAQSAVGPGMQALVSTGTGNASNDNGEIQITVGEFSRQTESGLEERPPKRFRSGTNGNTSNHAHTSESTGKAIGKSNPNAGGEPDSVVWWKQTEEPRVWWPGKVIQKQLNEEGYVVLTIKPFWGNHANLPITLPPTLDIPLRNGLPLDNYSNNNVGIMIRPHESKYVTTHLKKSSDARIAGFWATYIMADDEGGLWAQVESQDRANRQRLEMAPGAS